MYKSAFMITLTSLITACATPAAIDKMTVNPATKVAPQSTQLTNNIQVKTVSGGKSTNPLWVSKVGNDAFKQSLQDSLRNASLLSAKEAGDYELNANLQALEQPVAGLDMTVTAAVEYTLLERATQKVIYSKVISTPFTATFSDAALGFVRIKVANEGAIKQNIQTIINDLLALKLKNEKISMKLQ